MVKFSNDVDILKYEPVLFGELYLPWQVLIEADGGAVSGTTLTASGVDFIAAGVEAGGVVYLRSGDGDIDGAYEIVSVDSATQLTVSVVRSDDDNDAVAPPAGSDLHYRVCTYEPQATEAAYALTEYFGIRPGDPASDVSSDDVLDKDVLRRASVFLVISSLYAMIAGRDDGEGYWVKSHYYRKCFGQARSRARVSIDAGSDGVADKISHGGSVRLTRD